MNHGAMDTDYSTSTVRSTVLANTAGKEAGKSLQVDGPCQLPERGQTQCYKLNLYRLQ